MHFTTSDLHFLVSYFSLAPTRLGSISAPLFTSLFAVFAAAKKRKVNNVKTLAGVELP